MGQQGRADLEQYSEDTFPTNLNKEIQASDHRDYNKDIIDSKFNLLDDDIDSILIDSSDITKGYLGDLIGGDFIRKAVPAFWVEIIAGGNSSITYIDTNAPFPITQAGNNSAQDGDMDFNFTSDINSVFGGNGVFLKKQIPILGTPYIDWNVITLTPTYLYVNGLSIGSRFRFDIYATNNPYL